MNEIAGAAKANIVVRISRRVIKIRCERPGVTRVIPITAALEGVLRLTYLSHVYDTPPETVIQLTSILPISLSFSALTRYCFTLIRRESLASLSIIRK